MIPSEVRPIDANAVLRKLVDNGWLKMDALKDSAAMIAVHAILLDAPTLEPPPNPPLSLEELREMNGEPVWCVDGSGNKQWGIVNVYGDEPDEFECFTACYGRIAGWCYGMKGGAGWLAYRRKTEGDAT